MAHPTKVSWARVAMLMCLLALASCEKNAGRGDHASRQWPAAIAECDPAGYIRCIADAAWISVPVANTGLSLTYRSSPDGDSTGRAKSSAATLGIGGWSIDAVRQFDRKSEVLLDDDGQWHAAHGVSLQSGETAVPSYDGAVAYVFDSAGRHVRTVDGYLGTVLLNVHYDAGGRVEA